MTMISKTALGIAAGIFGTLFVGYCVYFDQQRRKDPNFKKKLRERRKANKLKCQSKAQSKLPDLRDHEEAQAFFLHEAGHHSINCVTLLVGDAGGETLYNLETPGLNVQLGEELLGQGDIEGGVEHLGNAVAVCGRPNQLLKVLQQTLPPNVFYMLLQRLPSLSQRLLEQPCGGGGPIMVEDEVE